MAFLNVGAVSDVPVAIDSVHRRWLVIADTARMLGTQMRRVSRGTKREIQVKTTPMTRTDANTLANTIVATGTKTCSGDLWGTSLACFVDLDDWASTVLNGGAEGVVITFTMQEV